MTSKSSRSVLSMEEYKAVLAEASSVAKPYSETAHLFPLNELLQGQYGLKGVATEV